MVDREGRNEGRERKPPPTRVSSEGGGRDIVGDRERRTPSDLRFEQGRGQGHGEVHGEETPPTRVSSEGGGRGMVGGHILFFVVDS